MAGLKPSQKAPVVFVTGRTELAAVLQAASADITPRTRDESVTVLAQETAAQRSSARTLAAVSGELQVLLPIEGLETFRRSVGAVGGHSDLITGQLLLEPPFEQLIGQAVLHRFIQLGRNDVVDSSGNPVITLLDGPFKGVR